MDANLSTRHTPAPGSGEIVVMPTSEAYVDQLEELMRIGYDVPADYDGFMITADMFRNHIRVFPEGQYMAIDTSCDRVVGFTTSMRIQYDPSKPFVEPWFKTTGYG